MRVTQNPEPDMEFIKAYAGVRLFGTRLTFQGSGNGNMTAAFFSYSGSDEEQKPRIYFESAVPRVGKYL